MDHDWHRRMEGFKGDGQKYKMRLPSILPQKKQENLSQASSTIHWSSSDDDEEKSKPLVVVRLDFGKCVQGSAGQVKPQVSRSLITKTTFNDSSICSHSSADPCSPLKCSQKYDIDSPSSPLQPSNLTTPKSPNLNCKKSSKCTADSPLNDQDDIEISSLLNTPEPVRPKSPLICSARKRNQAGKATHDMEESQNLTPRAVSPILSRSRRRKSIPQPKSLSPVLSRKKKKKLMQSNNVRKNLDSTSSQLVSQVHTQKIHDATGIILETFSQVQDANQSKRFDDGSQNLSFEDPCTQHVYALDQCQSITLQHSQQVAHAPIIEECSPDDSYTQHINIVHTQQPPAVDSGDHLEHSFAVPCSPHIVVEGLSQEVQIEDSSQEIDSDTPNVDEFPSQESYSFMHSAIKTGGEECLIQEMPPSSSSQSTVVSTTDNLLDRSKKHRPRKMIRNGLAMQLKRALARQRSTQCMWQHERFKKLENSNDEGQKLAVTNVKYEFRRILVHGTFQSTGQPAILLLQPQRKRIKCGSHITIFPPWQQFDHPRLGIPVLFGVNLIELESTESTNTHLPAPTQQVPSNLIRQIFTCPCRQDPTVRSHQCTFKLPGNVVRTLFWPSYQQRQGEIHVVESSIDRELTIASAVRSHANNPGTPLQLLLCCQRVYCYRLPSNLDGLTSQSSNSENSSQNNSTQFWQALGQDLKGEMCLVELGRRSDLLLEGSLFHLQNLSIVKRLQVARNPGLQSILSNINPQHKQSVVFLFSATHSEAPRLIEGPMYPSWISPHLSSQTQIFSQEENRITLVARVLYLHETTTLYVQPVQWCSSEGPSYLRITLRPWSFLPETLSPLMLLFWRDLYIFGGEMFIDRYSAVIDFKTIPKSQASPWMTRLLSRKFSLQPVILPSPGDDSSVGDLVTAEAAIRNVDEHSACVWPVCGACSSEVLREVDKNPQSLECVLCGSRGPFPNNVALTVELNLPGHVKVKLQQSTIKKILPGVEHTSETYDIESVLDHPLGPFMCIVSEKSKNVVTLIEISQDAEIKTS